MDISDYSNESLINTMVEKCLKAFSAKNPKRDWMQLSEVKFTMNLLKT